MKYKTIRREQFLQDVMIIFQRQIEPVALGIWFFIAKTFSALSNFIKNFVAGFLVSLHLQN